METNRRDFVKKSALALGALSVIPSNVVFSKNNSRKPSEKVNLACVGIGNRGKQVMQAMINTSLINVVALCDVDMGGKHTLEMMEEFPKAPQYKDFRKMFDEMGDDIEAVMIATPDFSHFPITMLAMSLGKHVYVEKPMARTFNEVELMIAGAKKYGVVTQMGNQGHSGENYFQFKAWQEAGVIKDVTSITAHMNKSRRWHAFDPTLTSFPAKETMPKNMDWDVWLNTAQHHDYNKDYHNGQWRCWYDFGMGALGDWGAHLLDAAHQFLDLGLPTEVNPGLLDSHNSFFYPYSTSLQFKFPERGNMPACNIDWYDGLDNLPPIPEGYGGAQRDDAAVPAPQSIQERPPHQVALGHAS
jgi:predicted dehydrogenase